MRHKVLLQNPKAKIIRSYCKRRKINKNSNHVGNSQYDRTKRADKRCEMIDQIVTIMSV